MSKERSLRSEKGRFLGDLKQASNTISKRRGQNLSIYLRAEHLDKLKLLCRLYKKKLSEIIQDLIDMHYGMIHLVVQETLSKLQKSKIDKKTLSEIITEIIGKTTEIEEKITEGE